MKNYKNSVRLLKNSIYGVPKISDTLQKLNDLIKNNFADESLICSSSVCQAIKMLPEFIYTSKHDSENLILMGELRTCDIYLDMHKHIDDITIVDKDNPTKTLNLSDNGIKLTDLY